MPFLGVTVTLTLHEPFFRPLSVVLETLQNFVYPDKTFNETFDFESTGIFANMAIDLAVAGFDRLTVMVFDTPGTGVDSDEKLTARLRVKVNPIALTPLAVTDPVRVACTRRMHRPTLMGMMFPSTIWHPESLGIPEKSSVDATICTCSGEQSLKIVASLIMYLPFVLRLDMSIAKSSISGMYKYEESYGNVLYAEW